MALDPTTNFAQTELDVPGTGYGTGDTSISVVDASEFPDPSTDGAFNIIVFDVTQGSAATATTREIMRVTDEPTVNDYTVTRAQEGTTAQTYSDTETYRVILAPTAKMFSDIDSGFQPLSSSDNHVESFTGDLNNHLQGIVFADTGHTNSPNGNNGICRAYSLDDSNVVQRFEEIGANVEYWRRKSGGTWQTWNLIGNVSTAASNALKDAAGTTLDTINAATSLQIGGADVYESSTYTPTVTPSTSGSITLSTTNDLLSYKVFTNDLVVIHGRLVVDSVTSPVGRIDISLPFAIASSTEAETRSTGIVAMNTVVAANVSDFLINMVDGQSNMLIYLGDSTTVQADAAEEVKASTQIYLNVMYSK